MSEADALEVVPGFARSAVQGAVPDVASEQALHAALEQAFDYRGNVTITRKDGSQVEGYIFDRRPGTSLQNSFVRIIPTDSNTKTSVPYSDVAGLAFTGRDTAAGKSWEMWLKKYWEKRAVGEAAEILPDANEA